MIKEKKIKLPIFNYSVKVVIFDSREEIIQRYPEFKDAYAALTLEYEGSSECTILIPKDKDFISNMAHELVHAKNCLFRFIQQHCDRDNDEIEAYIIGYLVSEILKIKI